MTLPAGKRSSYLTVWTVTDSTADAAGGVSPVATKRCNAWGEVKAFVPGANAAAIRGQNEAWASFHMNVNANFIITIPYVSGIEATDKITEITRSGTLTYQVAGQPLDNGGDLIIPVMQEV
jgi:hypothetical protein